MKVKGKTGVQQESYWHESATAPKYGQVCLLICRNVPHAFYRGYEFVHQHCAQTKPLNDGDWLIWNGGLSLF